LVVGSDAGDKMRDDCPDLTQKEIGRYKGKWDKLQMPIESIVTVALDADLNVFFSCKWYKMEFVNVWYKYVGDERVTALLEHFRDLSLSLFPDPAKRFWERVDLEGLCEDGVNPNCRGVITPIELTAEDLEVMRDDPRWSQGQQLNDEVRSSLTPFAFATTHESRTSLRLTSVPLCRPGSTALSAFRWCDDTRASGS
jgi:hypothetical protein